MGECGKMKNQTISVIFTVLLILIQCGFAAFGLILVLGMILNNAIPSAIIMLLSALVVSPLIRLTPVLKKIPILRAVLQFVMAFVLFIISFLVMPPLEDTDKADVSSQSAIVQTETDTAETESTEVSSEDTAAASSISVTVTTSVSTTTTTTTSATTTTTETTVTTTTTTTEIVTTTVSPATVITTYTTVKPVNTITYVCNTSSMKFHYPSCSSVDNISSQNRSDSTKTREELIAMGYDPCGRCHP